MKLMNYPINNNFYEEVGIQEFSTIVGEDFLINIVNNFLFKISDLIKKNSIDIRILKNLLDNTFSIYDELDNELLLLIEKNEFNNWYCKPIKIQEIFSIKILQKLEISSLEEGNFLEKLISFNSFPDADSLCDYLYRLCLIFVYEFNLELNYTDIAKCEKNFIIIDGIKKEFLEKNKQIEEEDVIYWIDIDVKKELIHITKIFENNVKKYFQINLTDYFLQENLYNEFGI